VVVGLLDIVCMFWVYRSHEIHTHENASYRSLLEKKAAKILCGLFKFYKVLYQESYPRKSKDSNTQADNYLSDTCIIVR
jgi:hypothetical protein